jgi:CHAT domain-containing protein/tetratricopeptide (TPR) repeat protein
VPKILFFILFFLSSFLSYGQGESVPLWKTEYDSAQLFWKSNTEKTIGLLIRAERTAFNDLGIYDENYLAILSDLGLAYAQKKDYKSAEVFLKKNLAIQLEIFSSDDLRVLQSRGNLAAIKLKSGKDGEAISLYKNILAHSNEQSYMDAAECLSRIYESHELYDSAMLIVNSAFTFKFGNPAIRNTAMLRLTAGRILRKNKKYIDALESLTTLQIDVQKNHDTHSNLGTEVKIELSILHIEMGRYIQAENDLLELYRAIKKTDVSDQNLLMELTNALGYTYEKLGIYDKALQYYLESLNRCGMEHGFNSFTCMMLQNNIAGVHLKQGLFDQSILEYTEFIKSFKESKQKESKTYLIALNNLASAYRQNGQLELALRSFVEVYDILERKGQLSDDLAGTVMNNIAVICTARGEHIRAVSYFEKVLKIKERVYGSDSPVLLDVVGNLAVSYWVVKRYSEALPLFSRSLTLAQKQVKYVFPNLTETEQIQFYREQKQNFERFNTLSIQASLTQPELLISMFNNQLLLKSLVFFTNKKRNAALELKGNAQVKELAQRIQSRELQLGHLYQLPLNESETLGISIRGLEHEIDSLEKIVRQTLHEEESVAVDVAWEDVQRALKGDEAAIEIIRFRKYDAFSNFSASAAKQVSIGFTDSVYYAALITTHETVQFPKLILIKGGNFLETRFLNYYRNAIKFDVADSISYRQFWMPLESGLAGKRAIFVSSDGAFHQVNLNAIINPSGKYVLEEYDINSILNAGQLIGRVEKKPVDFSTMVLFGDPVFNSADASDSPAAGYESLPGTRDEVNGIVQALKLPPSHQKTFMRLAANEANLRAVSSPSILHIATHGFFSTGRVYVNDHVKNDFLFQSGLILSSGNPNHKTENNPVDNDGIVTAYDVMNLDLTNTALVVLSACETGLGKIENSEGVYGLQRSFLQAGASDILVSLWKVEDIATKNLMIKFYSYLALQNSSRNAFRQAQLDILHEGKTRKQWAGFVMISSD